MKVTKKEHACLIIEDAGKKLIIDPGSFTTPLVGVSDVVAIVITHEHADHWTSDQLDQLLAGNPEARIFGPPGVVTAATEFAVEVVKEGVTVEAGPFTLRFFGTTHAVIHSSYPRVDNVGVLVNEELYYAGDSFTIPDGVTVQTLAVPSGAPWLKIGEVMDYVAAVSPRRSFPVHEMVLSGIGQSMSNGRIKSVTEERGGEFFVLEPGDELDL